MDEEIENIYTIGAKNGYESKDIDECYKLARKTFYTQTTHSQTFKNCLVIPYHPIFENIAHPLRILNIHQVFSYNNTIDKQLIRNSPKYDEGIVYQIPCTCKQFYIGQTGKKLEKRKKQHQYSIRRNENSNAINVHQRSCNQPILWEESRILLKKNDYLERCLLEIACISISNGNNFNNHAGIFKVDPLFLHIVQKQYKINKDFFNI